jgi:hypothetical protein
VYNSMLLMNDSVFLDADSVCLCLLNDMVNNVFQNCVYGCSYSITQARSTL